MFTLNALMLLGPHPVASDAAPFAAQAPRGHRDPGTRGHKDSGHRDSTTGFPIGTYLFDSRRASGNSRVSAESAASRTAANATILLEPRRRNRGSNPPLRRGRGNRERAALVRSNRRRPVAARAKLPGARVAVDVGRRSTGREGRGTPTNRFSVEGRLVREAVANERGANADLPVAATHPDARALVTRSRHRASFTPF
ncbi:unnamed protein product [Lampetra planeri]